MNGKFVDFIRNESGATAIEYALIAGGVTLLIVGAISTLSGNVKNQYGNIANSIP